MTRRSGWALTVSTVAMAALAQGDTARERADARIRGPVVQAVVDLALGCYGAEGVETTEEDREILERFAAALGDGVSMLMPEGCDDGSVAATVCVQQIAGFGCRELWQSLTSGPPLCRPAPWADSYATLFKKRVLECSDSEGGAGTLDGGAPCESGDGGEPEDGGGANREGEDGRERAAETCKHSQPAAEDLVRLERFRQQMAQSLSLSLSQLAEQGKCLLDRAAATQCQNVLAEMPCDVLGPLLMTDIKHLLAALTESCGALVLCSTEAEQSE